jgi:uncharacterized protein (DUF1501 family)
MPKPTKSDAASSATPEDQEIRERVKGLTSQALQRGRIDPEAIKDIVRTVIGAAPDSAAAGAEARDLFVDAVRKLDEALMKSSSVAHDALQQLAMRGKDFTDNDLKQALASLRELEHNYAAAVSRIGEAMTGKLRSEMMELAVHAQNVGAEASARVASMMGELAEGMSVAPGMAKIRDTGVRMALLASGVLGGVADALREQSEAKKSP